MAVKNLCSCSSSRARQQQLLFFCLALSLHVPYHANSLSFSFYSSFNPDDFRPEDDARVLDGRIELLGDEFAGRSRGRAWHKQPVQLWDGTTGEAASFTIQSVPGKGAASAGHGMTFFLAPYTPDPPQESYDGCLGLFDESEVPNYSRFNASGDSSLVDAGVVFATVVYDNRTRGLEVSLMVGSATYTSVATVDLRSLLPEKVAVGFSAATGDEYSANHTVLSFSFLSTLATKNSTAIPVTSSTKKTTLQFSAGAAAAGLLFLLLVVTVAVLLVQRSRRSGKQPYDEDRLTKDGDDSLDVSDFESSTGPRPIPYAQLAAATKDFAAEGKLGQGGSGLIRSLSIYFWALSGLKTLRQ
ncbi:unnamed protein product [Miscanthus lutarioriparius]|uniref:Legume lectin domain-containing protein n=1 Tax=Miscanthus lutarioriparius TaxID=422564 RepID=A0A811R2T2_9POAL|nr:unnamed protein product [Miscanthus lutarioriparius]